MKPNEIKIPVKQFSTFVEAAATWVAKKPEYRKGLEIRLLSVGHNLHVSVGADSHYIEAVLMGSPESATLEAPLFLELSYLADFSFDVEELVLVKPQERSGDRRENRAQFKAPGCNFRIPVKNGEIWERHKQNINQFETAPGMRFKKEFIDQIYEHMQLPNSFGSKAIEMVVLQLVGSGKIEMYSSDEWGAYLHTFSNVTDFEALPGFEKMTFPKEFLKPYEAFKKEKYPNISMQQTLRHTVATIKAPELGFEKIAWIQPNFQKPVGDVSSTLKKERSKMDSCLTLNTKEFVKSVKKAMEFFKEGDFKGVPLEFSITEDLYNLKADLPHSEMNVEGQAAVKAPNPLRAKFQAQSLKDYLDCMEKAEPFNMEIFRASVVIYQALKNMEILYWMPVHDR
jgi:hypothetical protein